MTDSPAYAMQPPPKILERMMRNPGLYPCLLEMEIMAQKGQGGGQEQEARP